MSALGGEIGKIAAFAPGSEIRRSDIDAVTEPVLDAVVFQMTDALGAGDYEGALKKLQVLYQMQQEPISILGAVGAHLRRISTARILIDAGKGGVGKDWLIANRDHLKAAADYYLWQEYHPVESNFNGILYSHSETSSQTFGGYDLYSNIISAIALELYARLFDVLMV